MLGLGLILGDCGFLFVSCLWTSSAMALSVQYICVGNMCC